ncbi:hypothetical protein AB28_3114 [Raoultella ornithinolytica 2-156-04_S1_C2]|nr:hypothetical protein AB00_3107 [Raoultella ornithinolytica 2-156-04_S1_C1]KDX13187.1 hypothetical protein AB28_3114 [Raoultella ornithinolytica 2-156-04_S1_C2]
MFLLIIYECTVGKCVSAGVTVLCQRITLIAMIYIVFVVIFLRVVFCLRLGDQSQRFC